jgi:hypothetical protein
MMQEIGSSEVLTKALTGIYSHFRLCQIGSRRAHLSHLSIGKKQENFSINAGDPSQN